MIEQSFGRVTDIESGEPMVLLDLFVLVCVGVQKEPSTYKSMVLIELVDTYFESTERPTSFENEVIKEEVLSEVYINSVLKAIFMKSLLYTCSSKQKKAKMCRFSCLDTID